MPGYAGAGQAKLINPTEQKVFWAAETISVGELSLAWELARQTSMYYPWGFSVEVQFSGSPGVFEIDVMGADTDMAANFVKIGSITAVNAGFVGRADFSNGGATYAWPRYIALSVVTFPNAVTASGKVSR